MAVDHHALTAANEEVNVAAVVETLAEADAVLVTESGETIPLASQDAVEMLSAPDPIGCPAGVQPVSWGGTGVGCTTSYTSIQAAVDDALVTDGWTIYVDAGTYIEQIDISKNITLRGAVNAIIQSPSTLDTSFGSKKAVVYVHDADANITNFTVDGNGQGNANYQFVGIAYYNASGDIWNNTVTGITNTPFSGVQGGVGIYVLNDDGTLRTVDITNNTVNDYQKAGIVANGDDLTANITGNIVTGQGPTSVIAQNGIQVGFGATGTISNNTVSENAWTGTYGGSNDPATDPEADGSAGILLYMPGSGVEIHHNNLADNQFGVWSVAAPDVNIHDNTISGMDATDSAYPTGIAIWSEDMWTGYFTGGAEQATAALITNKVITHHEYGMLVRDFTAGGVAPSASLSGNTFTNNDVQVEATGGSDFDAAGTLTGNSFDQAVTVEHSSSLLSTIWSAIQDGITAAVGGDIVYVGAGTYTENVQITKSISLQGAGQGLTMIKPESSDPTDGSDACTYGSCPRATNTVIWVKANGVAIYDLTVDGDNSSLTSGVTAGGADLDAHNGILTSGYSNLTIQDVTVQNIYQRGIQAGYSDGLNISNNTVNNVQGSPYYSIGIFNFGGGGTITGNTLTNVGDGIANNWSQGTTMAGNDVSTFTGSGIHTDNVEGADVISGNTISDGQGGNAYGIFVFAPYEPVTVSGNDVSGVQYGLTASGNGWMDAPNTITFDGNTVEATIAGAYVTIDVWWYFSTDVNANFTNNTITSGQYGFYLESQGSEDGLPGYYDTTCPSGECTLDVLASGNIITTPLIADGVFYAIGSVPYYDDAPDYNGIYNFISIEDNTWQADLDMDGVFDGDDNCLSVANAGQEDGNGDGIGDACDGGMGSVDLGDSNLDAGFTANLHVVAQGYLPPAPEGVSFQGGGLWVNVFDSEHAHVYTLDGEMTVSLHIPESASAPDGFHYAILFYDASSGAWVELPCAQVGYMISALASQPGLFALALVPNA